MSDAPRGASSAPALDQQAAAGLAGADGAFAFGPSFFLGQLGRFVRDHCPSPDEHLPHVQLKLADGETLDLCHVLGVSAKWVVLAVRDAGSHGHEMTTVIVPFGMVQGVRIRARRSEGDAVGFATTHQPTVISAETLVDAVFGLNPRERTAGR